MATCCSFFRFLPQWMEIANHLDYYVLKLLVPEGKNIYWRKVNLHNLF